MKKVDPRTVRLELTTAGLEVQRAIHCATPPCVDHHARDLVYLKTILHLESLLLETRSTHHRQTDSASGVSTRHDGVAGDVGALAARVLSQYAVAISKYLS